MIYYQGKLIKMIFYTYSSFLSYKVTMQALSSIPVELSESLADPSIYSVNHQLLHGPKNECHHQKTVYHIAIQLF